MKITNVNQLKVGQHFTLYVPVTNNTYNCICNKISNDFSNDKVNHFYLSYTRENDHNKDVKYSIREVNILLESGKWIISTDDISLPNELFTMDTL